MHGIGYLLYKNSSATPYFISTLVHNAFFITFCHFQLVRRLPYIGFSLPYIGFWIPYIGFLLPYIGFLLPYIGFWLPYIEFVFSMKTTTQLLVTCMVLGIYCTRTHPRHLTSYQLWCTMLSSLLFKLVTYIGIIKKKEDLVSNGAPARQQQY